MKGWKVPLCVLICMMAIAAAHKEGQISNGCQTCIEDVVSIGQRVSSQYRDFIVVKERICGQIPAVGQPTCEQLLEAVNPVIRKAIAQPVQVGLLGSHGKPIEDTMSRALCPAIQATTILQKHAVCQGARHRSPAAEGSHKILGLA